MGIVVQLEKRELLEQYVIARQKDFYRLAYSYTHNSDAALDVVQEAITKAISAVNSLRVPEQMQTWFYRILVNESLSWLRRKKRLIMQADPQRDEAAPVHDREGCMDLCDAVERLDPKIRTVVVLRYFEDMKLEEIARVTGVNLSTVKTRLYKGLRLLKLDLEEL